MQELYAENYTTLMKDSKESLNVWRDMLCSRTGRHDIVKMSNHPKFIKSFNATPIKTPVTFFGKYTQTYSKIEWAGKGTTTAKTILKTKSKVGGLTQHVIPRLTINVQYTRQCGVDKGCHWDQGNRGEGPETDPEAQLVTSAKGGKAIRKQAVS